jgi:hypothetical protein
MPLPINVTISVKGTCLHASFPSLLVTSPLPHSSQTPAHSSRKVRLHLTSLLQQTRHTLCLDRTLLGSQAVRYRAVGCWRQFWWAVHNVQTKWKNATPSPPPRNAGSLCCSDVSYNCTVYSIHCTHCTLYNVHCTLTLYSTFYTSVSQTVVLGFCPCGPLRLNISQKKKDRKNKINVNCVSNTVVENLKQLAFKGDKSRAVRRTFWLINVVPTWKQFEKRCSTLYTVQCTLYATLYTYTVLYTLHCTPYTVHSTPGVLKLFLSAAHYLAMRNIAAHPRIEQLCRSIQAHVSH